MAIIPYFEASLASAAADVAASFVKSSVSAAVRTADNPLAGRAIVYVDISSGLAHETGQNLLRMAFHIGPPSFHGKDP